MAILPPNDIGASELFLKLSEARPSEVFDFPRRGPDGRPIERVRVMVLRSQDHDIARIEAHRKLKGRFGLGKDDLDGISIREVYGDATAREVLALCCHFEKPISGSEEAGAPKHARMFRDAEHVGELTADELVTLFHCYELVQHKFGPLDRDDVDADAWIKRLEEADSAFPLLSLSLPRLVNVASSLAARLSSLYRTLQSQWVSLPDSSKSSLASFSTAISWYGERPAAPGATGSESSAELPNEPLTLDDAVDLARRLHGK